ncbi:TPA: serine--tRNA ligase [Candidatus Sumerlaeota bacterium]|jgi:seryl-tRNA synthetase|nr:serine--tRNA ligase [Candidatus Sumerlaeota bacterium]
MLDIRLFRENIELVKKGLVAKKADPAIADKVIELDARRREITFRAETLKKERNDSSKEVGQLMKSGAKDDAERIKARVRDIGDEITKVDAALAEIESLQNDLLLRIPNLPHESAPVGTSEDDNVVKGEWGTKPTFSFVPKPHWDLAEKLGILDLERGARLTGSGFIVLKGLGAKLQRSLISFMLDHHVDHNGYTETRPPYLVNRQTMTGTGQLPKMEEDMYRIEADNLYLIPTAEVPVTNLHAGEILSAAELPITYATYTPCFRREAGAAGKESRGMTRVHQFDKVELVRTVLPETSLSEIEILRGHAESILQAFGLHYRILELCSADMSFAASKCYDLEVWAPGMDRYLEVSSCSCFGDFQARRANIRFRREAGAKPEFCHTLNASGVALPRLMIAIIEAFQQEDGSIRIPEPLRGVMGCDRIG